MPDAVLVNGKHDLTAFVTASKPNAREGRPICVRRRHWIEAYRSDDGGRWWTFKNIPVADTGRGNPPSLVKLKDGRLAITYGFRDEPYGIRAKLSSDNGETWSDEIVLRDDGGNWGLGYPRTAQRADGKMVTVYYFNNTPSADSILRSRISGHRHRPG